MKTQRITSGVSWIPDVLEKGKARACQLGRSFSNYVNQLVTEDLTQGAPHVRTPGRPRNKQRSN